MNTEITGAYSPDTIYGQLTTPFLDKQFSINAHTPYDKTEDTKQSFSQTDFLKKVNNAKFQVSDDIREMKGMKLNEELKKDIGVVAEISEFPPKPSSVSSFQASTLLDGDNLVYQALRNGYPADRAIVIGKAHNAYANIINQEKFVNPINNLINKNHQVK